jgi:hypothetical protein
MAPAVLSPTVVGAGDHAEQLLLILRWHGHDALVAASIAKRDIADRAQTVCRRPCDEPVLG